MTSRAKLNDPYWADLKIYAGGALHEKELSALGNDLRTRDYSQFVSEVTLSDNWDQPARKAEVTIETFDTVDKPPVEVGTRVTLTGSRLNPSNGQRLPSGVIFTGLCYERSEDVGDGNDQTVLTCYEDSTVLARNDEPRTWDSRITMLAVAQQLAVAYGFRFKGSVPGATALKQIIQSPGMTDWDAIMEASRRHYSLTRYLPVVRTTPASEGRGLELMAMGGGNYIWVLSKGENGNVISRRDLQSVEEMRTRVKVVDELYDDGTDMFTQKTLAEKSLPADSPLRKKFGLLTTAVSPDGTESDKTLADNSKAMKQAEAKLASVGRPKDSGTVTCLPIPGVRAGDRLTFKGYRALGLKWHIPSVQHKWSPSGSVMTLDYVWSPGDLVG